jgi:hypothetical protein
VTARAWLPNIGPRLAGSDNVYIVIKAIKTTALKADTISASILLNMYNTEKMFEVTYLDYYFICTHLFEKYTNFEEINEYDLNLT